MNTNTKDQLLAEIQQNGPISPAKLAQQLQISTQMAHRHLKALLAANKIQKIGTPPKVLYLAIVEKSSLHDFPALSAIAKDYIDQNYLVVKPDGQILAGLEGFQWWAQKTKQHKNFITLANEYITNHRQYNDQNLNDLGVIDATHKVVETFKHCYLDHLFYQSFYSLPKFGKTKPGQMIMLGKSGQDIDSIKKLAELCRQSIINIMEHFKLDGIIYAPHSIPRKISFLKEFKFFLNLPYPASTLNKVFAGKVPIAQKSLSKLEDRIENATNTIFLKEDSYHYKRLLVIDDAVGSGATLNAIAEKLKAHANAEFVCGFAVTGSLKGFDIISEI